MINMDRAARWSLSSADAFKRSGAAANSAMSMPIKCVIALPGSLILNFIMSPPCQLMKII